MCKCSLSLNKLIKAPNRTATANLIYYAYSTS